VDEDARDAFFRSLARNGLLTNVHGSNGFAGHETAPPDGLANPLAAPLADDMVAAATLAGASA
jgi:hypothetical protein